jgi:hypothetical protein
MICGYYTHGSEYGFFLREYSFPQIRVTHGCTRDMPYWPLTLQVLTRYGTWLPSANKIHMDLKQVPIYSGIQQDIVDSTGVQWMK